jgi:site-specific recombinase XerD
MLMGIGQIEEEYCCLFANRLNAWACTIPIPITWRTISAHIACRHWFTIHLRRAGMPRQFIQELRGGVRKEAIDIYDHIYEKELRESYLAHIPQLGI